VVQTASRAILGLLLGIALNSCKSPTSKALIPQRLAPELSKDATWPWEDAVRSSLYRGVTTWRTSTADGTSLDLIRFDFSSNPELRFAMYDQDEDDANPLDDRVDYFPRGVGHIVEELNRRPNESVIAAWNGLFFAYDRSPGSPPNGWARHIGPNVIREAARFNVGQHRWTFGVKNVAGKPNFRAIFQPTIAQIRGAFDYAADGAQLLIKDGATLRVQPFEESLTGSRPVDSDLDVGAIPGVDWMRTSRTSMAWSKDGRFFWLLVIMESDHEVGSKLASKYGGEDRGGWTLADLQHFWQKVGVWGAVNSDGGVVTQLATISPSGGYDLLPPLQAGLRGRLHLGDLSKAPPGGSLMTFYVSERVRRP